MKGPWAIGLALVLTVMPATSACAGGTGDDCATATATANPSAVIAAGGTCSQPSEPATPDDTSTAAPDVTAEPAPIETTAQTDPNCSNTGQGCKEEHSALVLGSTDPCPNMSIAPFADSMVAERPTSVLVTLTSKGRSRETAIQIDQSGCERKSRVRELRLHIGHDKSGWPVVRWHTPTLGVDWISVSVTDPFNAKRHKSVRLFDPSANRSTIKLPSFRHILRGVQVYVPGRLNSGSAYYETDSITSYYAVEPKIITDLPADEGPNFSDGDGEDGPLLGSDG